MIQKIILLFLFSLGLIGFVFSQHKMIKVEEEIIELYQSGRIMEALGLINQVLSKKPTIDLYDLKSQLTYEIGDVEESIVALTEMIKLTPYRYDLYFRRGMLFFETDRFSLAIDDFTHFLEYSTDETTAIYFRLDQLGQQQVQVKSSNMLNSEGYVHRALSYQKLDSLCLAEQDLLKAIETDSSADAFLNLGLLKALQLDTVWAIRMIQQAINKKPDFTLAWYNLLLLDATIEIPVELSQEVTFFPLLQYRAEEAIQQSDLELAGHLVQRLLNLFPDRVSVYEVAGRYYYQIQDFELAEQYFQEGLKISSSTLFFNQWLANTYFQMGDYTAAVSHYELYLVQNPTDSQIWFNAAVTYHRLKEYREMCRCISRLADFSFSNDQFLQMKRLCQ